MSHETDYASSPIVVGKNYRFDYPIEFVSLNDYSDHRGQTVTILRACTETEADVLWDDPEGTGTNRIVDRMWKVQAEDDWVGDAWESELVEV